MVLGPGALLLFFALPILLGVAGLRAAGITWRTDPLSYGGWVWMTGALLLAALELLRLVGGFASPGPLVAAALLLAAGLWGLGRRTPLVVVEPRHEPAAARIVLGVLLVLALLVTLQRGLAADWLAIVRDDEAIYWSRRAKLWFVAGGFGGVYARALDAGDLPNAGSPLLNPLLQLWAFDLAGRITHVVNRVPLQVFSLALILCTAGALRRAAGSWVAGPLLLLLVASAPALIATHKANSDVLVALGALVAGDALLTWRGTRAGPALAGLAATLLVWSKNEGLLYLVAFLGAALLLHGRRFRTLLAWPAGAKAWCVPVVCVLASTLLHNAWFEAKSTHGLGTEEISRFADAFQRLPPILGEIVRAFFDPSLNLVPGVFLLVCLLAPQAWRGRLGLLALAVVLAWLGLVLVYATTPNPLVVMSKSLYRVLSQLVPLQLLWIGALVQQLRERDGQELAARFPNPGSDAAVRPSSASVPAL